MGTNCLENFLLKVRGIWYNKRKNEREKQKRKNVFFRGELPVIDGAAALYPVFSAFVNAVYPQGSACFDGNDFTSESKLQMNNTRGAYKGIADGSVDIAVCVGPSEEQIRYAEKRGAKLELVPIGREAFVFLVNEDNPISELSSAEIRGIYDGTYTNWKELGGKNFLINPLQRNAGSGSQTAMLSFMKGREMKKNFWGFLGSAIGFSFRYYVEDVATHGGIKMVQWMCSAEGQRIVEETGYAPVQ